MILIERSLRHGRHHILYRVHSNAAGGLSSSFTFTELISVDGYEERQVTEAYTSLSLAAVPQT